MPGWKYSICNGSVVYCQHCPVFTTCVYKINGFIAKPQIKQTTTNFVSRDLQCGKGVHGNTRENQCTFIEINEPPRGKKQQCGFRTGLTQPDLYKNRKELEA